MASIRHNLRRFAAVCAVWQLTVLTAIIPIDCCAAHRATETHCRAEASAIQCPMRGIDGMPCPMHRASSEPGHDTVLKGTCTGPIVAFMASTSAHAVLPKPIIVSRALAKTDVVPLCNEQLVAVLDSPDPPPPRG